LEQLILLAAYKDACTDARKHSRPPPEPPQALKDAGIERDFLQKMSFASGAMKHSAERGKLARKAMWAMCGDEGKATLFVTINPDDQGSLLIHMLRGGEIDSEIPPLHVRRGYLAHYPGASALAFERFMEVFIQVIVGWDPDNKRSTAQGGIFGYPEAWFQAVEEQSRLSLHAHTLIWIAGHDQLRERMLADNCQGIRRLQSYLDAVMTASFPLPESMDKTIADCPNVGAGCAGQLEEDPQSYRYARKRHHNLGVDPPILRCNECSHPQIPNACADKALRALWFDRQHTRDPHADSVPETLSNCLNGDLPKTSEDVNALKWRGLPPELHADDQDLFACVLIRHGNWHKATHMPTCLKSAKAKKTGLCRARLPADLCAETVMEVLHPGCPHAREMIDEMSEEELAEFTWDFADNCEECGTPPLVSFALRRTAASSWMPQCSPALTKIYGCNNNIQYVYNLLLGFYQGMYASKSTKESQDSLTDCMRATERQFLRHAALEQARQDALDRGEVPAPAACSSEFSLGLRRLNAAWRGHTKSEQIGAARAAFFLLGYDGWMQSRDVAKAAPNAAVAWLTGQELYCATTRAGQSTPSIFDYVFRPESLEDLCWLEYVRLYERVPLQQDDDSQSDVEAFLEDHPLHDKSGIRKRFHWVYPQVQAKRCPDRRHLDELDQKQLYAHNALTLTVPFRHLACFGIDDTAIHGMTEDEAATTWWEAWVRAEQEGRVTTYGAKWLNNAQDYYTQVLCNHDRNDVDILDALDSVTRGDINATIEDGGAILNDDYLANLLDMVMERQNNKTLNRCEFDLDLAAHRDHSPPPQKPGIDPADLDAGRERMASLMKRETLRKANPSFPGAPTRAFLEAGDDDRRATFVDAVVDAVTPNEIREAISTVRGIKAALPTGERVKVKRMEVKQPTLAAVIKHYHFDQTQAEVFAQLGTVLLCRLALRFVIPNDQREMIEEIMKPLLSTDFQLVHLLLGMGGTGKSHIINGIVNLAYCWGAPESVLVTGMSNIAGVLLGGGTTHKAIGVSIDFDKQPTNHLSAEGKQRWGNAVLVIIDEISMAPPGLLHCLHVRGVEMYNRPAEDRTFAGGVDVLLCGDFSQLPASRGPLYIRAVFQDKPSLFSMQGADEYAEFMTSVSHLVKNHRQAESEKNRLIEVLTAIHDKNVTREQLEWLNSATLINRDSPRQPPPNTVFVTPENVLRERISRDDYLATAQVAPGDGDTDWRERGCLQIRMTVKRRGNTPLRPGMVEVIRQLNENEKQLRGLCPDLGIVLGQDYMVVDNFPAKAVGLVKSMKVKALDVDLCPGAIVNWDEAKRTHWVEASDVSCVLTKLQLGPIREEQLFTNFPPGVVPIIPLTKRNLNIHPSPGLTIKSISLTQIPIVSAKCMTGHKMQGSSADAVCLAGFLRSRVATRQWLYVALSRVTSLAGLFLLEPLPEDPAYWNKRDLDYDYEMARLDLATLKTHMRVRDALGIQPSPDRDTAIAAAQEKLRVLDEELLLHHKRKGTFNEHREVEPVRNKKKRKRQRPEKDNIYSRNRSGEGRRNQSSQAEQKQATPTKQRQTKRRQSERTSPRKSPARPTSRSTRSSTSQPEEKQPPTMKRRTRNRHCNQSKPSIQPSRAGGTTPKRPPNAQQ
jgi:hypothetical protein